MNQIWRLFEKRRSCADCWVFSTWVLEDRKRRVVSSGNRIQRLWARSEPARNLDATTKTVDSSRKRGKMRDLESVCRSDGFKGSAKLHVDENDESQAIQLDSGASQADKTGKKGIPSATDASPRPLDLNTEMCIRKYKVLDDIQECSRSSDKRESDSDFGISRGIGLDLNSEDFSSSMNQHPFFPYKNLNQPKPRDISECASSTGPLEENDPLKLWEEMKQNGFLSSAHGGIPIPKQRGRKTKTDVFKKKMEIAKKEQVDRFTKIAAPSGLLNELNPGIINHVRNRKQVHSIIKALVRSEKHEKSRAGNKQMSHSKSETTETGNSNDSALHSHPDRQASTASWVREARGFTASLVRCPSILEGKGVENDQTAAEKISLKTGASQSTLVHEDALALMLSSSTKMPENESSLTNEDSASYLSVKAATVASQWLELLNQDIKGRLAALRRSKKRVRAVISTELPFLLSKEFPCDQENNPYATTTSATGFSHFAAAEMHRVRWNKMFDQMDESLCEEERQLESWLVQVKEMQMHCEHGLHQVHSNPLLGSQQLGTSNSDVRPHSLHSERAMAVRATAASIYSACNFILTHSNVSCF